MLIINHEIKINEAEIELSFIRAPGPGGQNVNKVATAVLLRFNIERSTALNDELRARLRALAGNRCTLDGDILIKASRYRTQERNKQDALARLQALIKQATFIRKQRKKTKPSHAANQKRLTNKKKHGQIKALRKHKGFDNS